MTADLLATLARIVDGGGDVDDVLRAVVSRLAQEPGISWAGIRFVEGGKLVLGPCAGSVDEEHALATPIVYRAAPVGELVVHGAADGSVLARVADLVAPFVLLGWDTGGEAWVP
jgi:putative methionine-R-sulfoxide reductase with GAF domain